MNLLAELGTHLTGIEHLRAMQEADRRPGMASRWTSGWTRWRMVDDELCVRHCRSVAAIDGASSVSTILTESPTRISAPQRSGIM
jgi:hypothetical protein